LPIERTLTVSGLAADRQRVRGRRRLGAKRHLARLEPRASHVDGDLAARRHVRMITPLAVSTRIWCFGVSPRRGRSARSSARRCRIAPPRRRRRSRCDSGNHCRERRALDQQDLVAADAEMPVGDAARELGRHRDFLRTPSITTKSLPWPCILAKARRRRVVMG
jgi:hypothetical protein